MAGDLNLCQFIGRLGRDPETRYTPDGAAVTNFSIAVGARWKDKEGNQQESTEWVRCVAYKRLAEICGEYLTKGKQVYIGGRLRTREWDKDGEKRYTTEVVVDTMQMLGGKADNAGEGEGQRDGIVNRPPPGGASTPAPKKPQQRFDEMDDDIPF